MSFDKLWFWFIFRCFIKGHPYPELLKIDPFLYVEKEKTDFKRPRKTMGTQEAEAEDKDEDESEKNKEDVAITN